MIARAQVGASHPTALPCSLITERKMIPVSYGQPQFCNLIWEVRNGWSMIITFGEST